MAMPISALSLTWKWRSPAPVLVQSGQIFFQRNASGLKSVAESINQRPGFSSEFVRVAIRHSLHSSVIKRMPERLRVFSTVSQSDNGAENGVGVSRGDQLLRCISYDAEVSILTLVATDVVREAQRRHQTSPTASAALGRALVGTLLVGAMKGMDEFVQVTFLGQGPLGQMTTVYKNNMVKGFVGNPDCDPPLKANGKLDVGSAVGTGVLTVVRNNVNWAQPYSGTVPIYSGEVAEDIAHYLADSEQINVALGVGVTISKNTAVQFAGGFLVQVLPFCSDETLARLEENILKMPPLSDSSNSMTARRISEILLEGIGVGDYDDLPEPKFGPCTVEELKPRMVQAVASLGKADVENILAEQGHVEVKCEFCAEVVRFGEADLKHILQPTSQ